MLSFMLRGLQGKHSIQFRGKPESYLAFVPASLPPAPALEWNARIRHALSRADSMIGRLDGIGQILPDTNLFISIYSRKEAVLSSQIEGTQSTLSELLLFEADQSSTEHRLDILEISNYLAAMRHGLKRLGGGFPLSLRLIREMHQKLLHTGRGSDKTPGEFRTSQNWIGGSGPSNATYIPPPVTEMQECLNRFEQFLHDGAKDFPPLVQAALLHVQFESIHPFLDGNGRLGRLLVTLLLVERGVLAEPLLYPSLYLKQNRDTYYRLLQQVRMEGDWELWVEFFLDAIATTAESAVKMARKILDLFDEDEQKVRGKGARGASALAVLRAMQARSVSVPPMLVEQTQLSMPTVLRAVEELRAMGIVQEITGRERGRIYRYTRYVNLVNEGTEL
ncbi:Fic family protein [Silvibacterium bohemicum]|uniref:Fic family protein n=1 Tax=Silvibacterium bohemicum TaxID=1577686 RepID=A0A841JX57_9BACT|nr:Fic family protein [Silvibacterium bohemicum]MBB6145936.1 Fic family protein [Silvibacterium bohemicum]